MFKQIDLSTIVIKEISINFIDQMPTCLVFKNVLSMMASNYSTVYHIERQSLRRKEKI
jgi:hypothetical protein